MEFLEYLGTDWQIQIFAERGLIILRATRGEEVKYFVLKANTEPQCKFDFLSCLTDKEMEKLPVPKDLKKATFGELEKVIEWYRNVSLKVFPYQNRLEVRVEYLKKHLAIRKGININKCHN